MKETVTVSFSTLSLSSPTSQTSVAQYLCYVHHQMIEAARTTVETSTQDAQSLNVIEIAFSRGLRRLS